MPLYPQLVMMQGETESPENMGIVWTTVLTAVGKIGKGIGGAVSRGIKKKKKRIAAKKKAAKIKKQNEAIAAAAMKAEQEKKSKMVKMAIAAAGITAAGLFLIKQ